jgi:hypothetical protein
VNQDCGHLVDGCRRNLVGASVSEADESEDRQLVGNMVQ